MTSPQGSPDANASTRRSVRDALDGYLEQAQLQSEQFNELGKRTERLERRSLWINVVLAIIAVLGLALPIALWAITERSARLSNAIELSQTLNGSDLADAMLVQLDLRTQDMPAEDALRAIFALEPMHTQLDNLAACIEEGMCDRDLGLVLFCNRATQLRDSLAIAYRMARREEAPHYSGYFNDVYLDCS